MKAKSSTGASKPEAAPGTVLLQPKGTNKTKSFSEAHAENLLNYPGSVWERAAPAAEETPTDSGQPIQE